ncbi:MAG TPA: hypothetical protein VGO03_01505 [Acidimicrobiia bacterium]
MQAELVSQVVDRDAEGTAGAQPIDLLATRPRSRLSLRSWLEIRPLTLTWIPVARSGL